MCVCECVTCVGVNVCMCVNVMCVMRRPGEWMEEQAPGEGGGSEAMGKGGGRGHGGGEAGVGGTCTP